MTPHYKWVTIFLTTATLLGAGCATSTGTGSTPAANAASRIQECKSTDQPVPSSAQCLLDDAACYQISDGSWCTGERGSTCPAGSTELPAGTACPDNKRCFRISESMECVI